MAFALPGCSDHQRPEAGEAHRDGDDVDPDDGDVLFRREVVRDADGNIVEETVDGEETPELFQRVGRPWEYANEGFAYDEHAWAFVDDDGLEHSGYEIVRSPVPPVAPAPEPAAQGASDPLLDTVASMDPDAELPVLLKTSFSPPPLPLLPSRLTVTEQEYAAARAVRNAAKDDQAAQFETEASGVVSAVTSAGGSLLSSYPTLGWLKVSLPAGSVPSIATHENVLLATLDGFGEDGASCSNPNGADGDPVSLGDLRIASGSDYFDTLKYHGQISSGGEVLVGIHEGGEGKIDACFFGDFSGCNPSNRLRKKFDCSGSSCTSVSSFSASTRHGAYVASTLLGDYEQNQGGAYESQIASGVAAGWRTEATGFAREAEAHYYAVGSSESNKVDGIECAHDIGPSACAMMDIFHSANPIEDDVCDASSSRIIEDATENLFDDGVLPIFVSHNQNSYPSSDSCLVRSPADIPKSFTVGALHPDDNTDYHDWEYASYSNRGGGDVTVSFINRPDALSMIDLVASGLPGFPTDDAGNYGTVSPDGTCIVGQAGLETDPGTSFAGPQVAGAAAQVLDYFIENGWNWVTKPNRLHTVMLSMGDRGHNDDSGAAGPTQSGGCVSGDRLLCGADFYLGLGRLTLDLVVPFSHWQWTLTSVNASKKRVSPSTMPSNAEILKCVMHQVEDMSSKSDISRVEMTVKIRNPHPTLGCQKDYGTSYFLRNDESFDDKKMVTILDSEVNLGGRCYEVTWNVRNLSSAGKTSFHTFCSVDSSLEY